MGEHWSYGWAVFDKDWVCAWNVWESEVRAVDLGLKALMGSPGSSEVGTESRNSNLPFSLWKGAHHPENLFAW